MNYIRTLVSLLFLTSMLGLGPTALSAQEIKLKPGVVKKGVISAVPANRAGSYCHLKFPAIKSETLSSAKPELQDPKTGDIIDFYGPCNYDPLGYDEICRQRIQNANRDWCE